MSQITPDALAEESTDVLDRLHASVRQLVDVRWLTREVEGVWIVSPHFRPTQNERLFSIPFVLLNARRQGCAYFPSSAMIPNPRLILGRSLDALSSDQNQHSAIRVAALDAAIAGFDQRKISEVPVSIEAIEIVGSVANKARHRSALVAQEATRLIEPGSTVGLIGYSGQLERDLSKSFDVVSFDQEEDVIGSQTAGGSTVADGRDVYGLTGLDGLVATAMTLVTRSFDSVVRLAVSRRIPLILYAQTGANLAPLLILEGASTVVAEHVPFYNFEGTSSISIVRRND